MDHTISKGEPMSKRKRERMAEREWSAEGKYIDKNAVPKKGTKLTTERISKHYRYLNRKGDGQAGA